MADEGLLRDLLEQHRPVVFLERTAHPLDRLYQAHCPACDGVRWRMVREDDPVPVCSFWLRGVAAGIVQAIEWLHV